MSTAVSPTQSVEASPVDPHPQHDAERTATANLLRVVIVNYRTPKLTLDCLDSLEKEVQANPGTHVVVVEGGSGDDSPQVLREGIEQRGFGEWVTLDVREDNAGFAGSNNVGIIPAMAEDPPPRYILLLNPDTVVLPGALSSLVSFMDAHPKAGIAGSRLVNPDHTPRRSAFRFPGLMSELERGLRFGPLSKLLSRFLVAPAVRDEPHTCDWVAGASMIVRDEVAQKIGPMDDDYFLYYEETDYCKLAVNAGYECWYVPDSRVIHLVGQSTNVTGASRAKRPLPRYVYESRRRYFNKHHGRVYTLLADVMWFSAASLSWLRHLVTPGPSPDDPPRMLRDFFRFSLWRSLRLLRQP